MIKSSQHTCKNGEVITIRIASTKDADSLNALKRSYINTSDYIPLTAKEYKYDVAGESEMLSVVDLHQNSLVLLAENENGLIGNADLTGYQRKAMHHVAMLGMGMDIAWRNQGIGSFLLERVIVWAKQSPLQIICLDVYDENTAAKALYLKYGFISYGIVPGYFRHGNQSYNLNRMMLAL